MFQKIKLILLDDIYFYSILVCLVGLASFGLGRWSALLDDSSGKANSASIIIQEEVELTPTNKVAESSIETFVASKNGTKYHSLDCPGAKQIAEQNKIYFVSKTEAEASGYTPAANCPGL